MIVTAAVTKVSLHFDSSDEATNLNRLGAMFGEYNVLQITNSDCFLDFRSFSTRHTVYGATLFLPIDRPLTY